MNEREDQLSVMERLADHAMFGAGPGVAHKPRSQSEARELEILELTAASLHIALLEAEEAIEPMPASLRRKISASTATIDGASGVAAGRPAHATPSQDDAGPIPISLWRRAAFTGWAAAAALAIVAVFGWLRAGALSETPSQAEKPTYAQLVESGGTQLTWTDWALNGEEPEISGVQGDVVWDPKTGVGYMRFVGLPVNDPSETQYQLWIIDARYGDDAMGQRVSGGVFNASADGEIIVPIDPARPVDDPVAFALTIERPGGVWNSTMQRRVVIASKG